MYVFEVYWGYACAIQCTQSLRSPNLVLGGGGVVGAVKQGFYLVLLSKLKNLVKTIMLPMLPLSHTKLTA